MAIKRNAIQTYIALNKDEYTQLAIYAKLRGFGIAEFLGELARQYLRMRNKDTPIPSYAQQRDEEVQGFTIVRKSSRPS
jgi:hypothetical protein